MTRDKEAKTYTEQLKTSDPAVYRAIAGIDEAAWTPIKYPQAIFDDTEQRWISDAEVAEVPYTAFTSKGAEAVSGRLIVRRVKRVNPADADGQDTLFTEWRHHAVFTTSPLDMLQAEHYHRRHAIVEQVIADLKSGPLAHLPSGKFNANPAWLACAVIAFNLTRAAGALASTFHAKATTATIRGHLIAVPARIASSARTVLMHLPRDWPWETAWIDLHHAAGRTPTADGRHLTTQPPAGTTGDNAIVEESGEPAAPPCLLPAPSRKRPISTTSITHPRIQAEGSRELAKFGQYYGTLGRGIRPSALMVHVRE